jgi:hypothetical protein
MARRSKVVQLFDWDVLVVLEPRAGLRGRRLSSRASSAADARVASTWKGSSVGWLRRISRRPSASARLSTMTVTSTLVPLAQSCPLQVFGPLVTYALPRFHGTRRPDVPEWMLQVQAAPGWGREDRMMSASARR